MAPKAKTEKHAGGRPPKYNPDLHPKLAEAYAWGGATEEEIAQRLDVSVTTIANWKNQHPEFLDALTRGKQTPDDKVERSLYERATGYSFPSEKIMAVSDGKDKGSHIERVSITEHSPPDVTACIFWLKNRRKDKWRDRQDFAFELPEEPGDEPPEVARIRAELAGLGKPLTAEEVKKANAGKNRKG